MNEEFKENLKTKLLEEIDKLDREYFKTQHIINTKSFNRIENTISGHGEPLLFLHDIGVIPQIYTPVIDYLSNRHKVITPSLPGHGASKMHNSSDNISFEIYLEFINELLESLEIDEPIRIVGHSFGGTLALLYARQYPERVREIVIASPFIEPFKLNLLQQMKGYIDYLKFNKYIPLDIFKNLLVNSKNIFRTYKLVLNTDILDILHEVSSKVTVVWGENDNLIPLSQLENFKIRLKHAKIKMVDKRHHNWVFDSPHKLNV